MDTTLYILAAEYKAAADQLANLDLDEQTVADTLESMSGDFEQKALACAAMIRNMDSLAVAIKAEEERLSARRKGLEKRAESLTAYVLANMQTTGIKRVQDARFSVTVAQNPPAVVVDSPDLVPWSLLCRPEPPAPFPDKRAIKARLAAGETVPGCRLERGPRLSIK